MLRLRSPPTVHKPREFETIFNIITLRKTYFSEIWGLNIDVLPGYDAVYFSRNVPTLRRKMLLQHSPYTPPVNLVFTAVRI